jgi:hypothetical protein
MENVVTKYEQLIFLQPAHVVRYWFEVLWLTRFCPHSWSFIRTLLHLRENETEDVPLTQILVINTQTNTVTNQYTTKKIGDLKLKPFAVTIHLAFKMTMWQWRKFSVCDITPRKNIALQSITTIQHQMYRFTKYMLMHRTWEASYFFQTVVILAWLWQHKSYYHPAGKTSL